MTRNKDQILQDFSLLLANRITMQYFHRLFNRYHWEHFNYLEQIEPITYYAFKKIYFSVFRLYRKFHRKSKEQLHLFQSYSLEEWEIFQMYFQISNFSQLEKAYLLMYQDPSQYIQRLVPNFRKINSSFHLSNFYASFFNAILQEAKLQHILLDEDLPLKKELFFRLEYPNSNKQLDLKSNLQSQGDLPSNLHLSLQICSSQLLEDVMVKIIGNNRITHLQNGTPLVTSEYFEIIPDTDEFFDLMSLSLRVIHPEDIYFSRLFILVMKNNQIMYIQSLDIRRLKQG